MALQPRIDQPCPLRFGAMPQPGQDFCTRCTRQVHNLDRLDETARIDFLRGCDGPVCVAYSVRRVRPLAALVAAASVAMAGSLHAGEFDAEALPHSAASAAASDPVVLPGATTDEACDESEVAPMERITMVGGVSQPGQLDLVEVEDGPPELPRIAEDDLLDEVAQFTAPPAE
jgi:hypothetical protein